jgi:hypothetical protein
MAFASFTEKTRSNAMMTYFISDPHISAYIRLRRRSEFNRSPAHLPVRLVVSECEMLALEAVDDSPANMGAPMSCAFVRYRRLKVTGYSTSA